MLFKKKEPVKEDPYITKIKQELAQKDIENEIRFGNQVEPSRKLDSFENDIAETERIVQTRRKEKIRQGIKSKPFGWEELQDK